MMQVYDLYATGFGGMGLHFRLDGFRLVYACLAVLMWTACGIFSREYMAHYEKRKRYYIFFWVTFIATAGVFLSADLYTFFLFFEIMSFTSYVWVAFDERKESLRAAQTYLAVAVIGGMTLLMGLFILNNLCGTLEMDEAAERARQILSGGGDTAGERKLLYVSGVMMLVGFGAKAGVFPLHIWLPKAHPVAPAPASALLSGILTKTGIFGVIFLTCHMFSGNGAWGLLICVLGAVTMLAGAFLALFSVDLKRTLACSSVSQIGFIMTGLGVSSLLSWAGEENSLAVRGVFLHMVNHSLLKLVLFLCAGAVFMNLHELNLNEIRGFGRRKPALFFSFLMGALGISGVPFWNGYVSKTLLHEAIVEYRELTVHHTLDVGLSGAPVFPEAAKVLLSPAVWTVTEWIFLLAGGMTAAYMLKLTVALFVERHPVRQPEFDSMGTSYMSLPGSLAISLPAALLFFLGLTPSVTMDFIADLGQSFLGGKTAESVAYWSWKNMQGSLISLGIGIVLYLGPVRMWLRKRVGDTWYYVDRWPAWLDLENLIYRPVLTVLLPGIFGTVFTWTDERLFPALARTFMAVSAVFCRAMDQMADGLILLARKTTHRQVKEHRSQSEGNWLAVIVGTAEDILLGASDCLTGRRRRLGRRPSSVGRMCERERDAKHVINMVEESFSFGLMLFCIGLCTTLVYLLYAFFV